MKYTVKGQAMNRFLIERTTDPSDMIPSQVGFRSLFLVLVLLIIVTQILFHQFLPNKPISDSTSVSEVTTSQLKTSNSTPVSGLNIHAVLDSRALRPRSHALIVRGQLNRARLKNILDFLGGQSFPGSSVQILRGLQEKGLDSERPKRPCSREPQLGECLLTLIHLGFPRRVKRTSWGAENVSSFLLRGSFQTEKEFIR
ncbi:hypothetical protein TNCT_592711 [Trichonephila clavata]|uniref:Uncharacterized protein n=1 Tax=Trichonephila clavata TaxID=2740835 RepID=A0A8X6JKU4_TRICU|nr:hypothetical protein TNCT_592711 [Trichonephila clavata]